MTTHVLDAGALPLGGDDRRDEASLASNEVAVPLIELRKVCRTYVTDGGVEVRALRDVDLKIYPGEFVAIMGQSGSGKSTMMNILGCLDRPTGGTYLFAGRDIQSFDADGLAWLRREAFGFVFQSYNLLATETAEENVEVPGIYAGMSAAEREMRAENLLSSLGLGDRLDHRPNQLSGGQQQRVSVARALMNGGNIILADEPTGALDSKSGIEVMALLEDLARKGHTVILISHDINVANHADRIIEFSDGELVNDSGHADGVIDPAHNIRLREMFMGRQSSSLLGGLGEAVRMAMRSLISNMFRTFLTLLGIVIGVASVVAMLAVGQGAQQDIVERISGIGTNMLTLQPQRGGDGQRRNMPSRLSFEDADAILEGVPNVLYTLPELQSEQTIRYGRQDHRTRITATSESLPLARNWPLARGVFFTRRDSDNFVSVAVLGATVYDALFPDGGDPLGEWVLIRNVPFQIIGVLTRKGASGNEDQDEAVYVPLKTGALRLFGEQYARAISVAVDDISKISQTERNLVEFMLARHGVEDFRIFNASEMLETLEESQATFTLMLGSIGAISLLVGGIGVMNIMLVSVTERTREIGVRMATGARQSDILAQFLSEAIVVTAVGGVLGILVGVGVGQVLQTFNVDVVFSTQPMVLAFSCATAIGLIFGFAPARKAARLDPVVALSNE